ncbi:hypothetical protein DM01DRAFT_1410500 [Hesseltinella vesiculosa]|uniref:Small ribosomal subunit protein mS23 n=1 Tax=Hesseltinella vesiculosa TaxID=101127 RepID=A0A1X2G733_9FUNG|nr:hypothetical protein DM01DRAFT_1410500 [Hesseltinella vesiculosa]
MAHRVPPTGLVRQVSNLMKGNLIKDAPVWLPVLKTIPPGPSIIRTRPHNDNINAQSAAEMELMSQQQPTKSSIRHKQKNLRTKPPRPQPIVYPEDRLRRQFYKDHPFELSRPKVLVEGDSGKNRTDFTQLLLPGMRLNEIDGEAVIKYQLHLMTAEKIPERQAYATATSEFYKIRAQQEEEEREARAKMTDVLHTISKQTRKALYHEEQALIRGMNNQPY